MTAQDFLCKAPRHQLRQIPHSTFSALNVERWRKHRNREIAMPHRPSTEKAVGNEIQSWSGASPEDLVRTMLDIVVLESPRKIGDLAARLNLSQSYVQHVFKRHTGAGLGRLIMRKKMERAAHLLRHTAMSIKEIAFAVGYEHSSSFVRAFERQFQQTPQHYRRQSRSTKC